MTIEHMDNFSIYGIDTTYMLNGLYAQVGNTFSGIGTGVFLANDPDGISPGSVLQMTGSYGAAQNYSLIRYTFSAGSVDKVGAAFRVWLPELPADTVGYQLCFTNFRDNLNNNLASLRVDTTGRLQVMSNGWKGPGDNSGSVIASTATPVITANGWYHIEFFYDGTTGDFELRVEGAPVLTGMGLPMSTIAQMAIVNDPDVASFSKQYFVKDFVIWNSDGLYNNDFLGSVIVANLLPSADIDLNWTPSNGATGYNILDNIPPVDAQYISAAFPAPPPYVADLTDLPPDVTSVKGVMTFVRAAKTDGGDGFLQVSLISDGTTGDGANRPITVAQTYWRDLFEEDPATSAPWIPSAVNDAEIQLNRTA